MSRLRDRIERLEAAAPRAVEELPPPFWSETHGCLMQAVAGGSLVVPAPVSPEEWERAARAQQEALTREIADAAGSGG